MNVLSTDKAQRQVEPSAVFRAPDVVFCSVSEGGALLNLSRGVYFGLDAVGTRIWELLQEPQSAARLTASLMAEYDVSAELCRKAVLAFLGQMSAQGLIKYEAPAAYE